MVAMTYSGRHSTEVLVFFRGIVSLVGSTGIDSDNAPVDGNIQIWWWLLLLTMQTICIIFRSWRMSYHTHTHL